MVQTQFIPFEITTMVVDTENPLDLKVRFQTLYISTPIALYVSANTGVVSNPNTGDANGRIKIPGGVARYPVPYWRSDKFYFRNQVGGETSTLILVEGTV
jgi:hypothetical protein